ncbi:MAG: ABC transporter ATP-binding protein [Eubacteriales bacterium]|nr:ABC transporter ATP-binding protein [Eubacteriales bacterium]
MSKQTASRAQAKKDARIKQTKEEMLNLGFEIPEGVKKHVDEQVASMFDQEQASQGNFIKRIFQINPVGKKIMGVSILVAVFAELLAFASVFFGAYAASFIYRHAHGEVVDFSMLRNYGLMALGALLLYLCLAGASSTLSHKVAFQTLHLLRIKLFSHLQEIPQGYLVENSLGKVKLLIQDRVAELEDFIAHVMPELPSRILHPILSFAILLYIDWRIALASLVTLPITILGMIILFSKYQGRYLLWNSAYADLAEKTVDYARGIPVVKAFRQTEQTFGNFSKSTNFYHDTTMAWWRHSWVGMSLVLASMSFPLIGCLPVALYLFKAGAITVAELFLSIILPLAILPQAYALMMSFEVFTICAGAWSKICELLYLPAQVRPAKAVSEFDLQQGVRFEKVSFSYLSGQEVLHQISFDLQPNSLTALVGHSGSGKTTVARLLLGFWDQDSGKITIGGIDNKLLPFEQLMSEISYVSQENYLFDATIAENIKLGKPDATEAEVIAAAKAAHCHEFISAFPGGYDTNAGEAGGQISGGERQRITIARAILKPSKIVVLDEATAYTDPENEAEIQKAIYALLQDKTVLVIAHRLHSIVGADQIIVMDEGRIVGRGTHAELIAQNATYKKLWAQYSGEEL